MGYVPPAGDAADFSLASYSPPDGDDANFPFTIPVSVPFPLGFGVSKRLLTPTSPDPLGVAGIWQMRMTKRGKVPIKMKFYTPTNPQTVPQQANRAKFAAAMSTWVSLTPEQKASYTERAKKIQTFGWSVFIREYYQTH